MTSGTPPKYRDTRLSTAPFSLAIFVSAFLVFQVQPVIARYILPWYGGTPGVWTTSMLFFQIGLLAGYLYAHALAKYLQTRQQIVLHSILLLLSAISLPITPNQPAISDDAHQVIEILIILAKSVGFPFIILSASAPLLQHWFASSFHDKSPFRLYALSNAGSLLALLSYPFLVEPILTLSSQTWSWSIVYGVFILATLWCAHSTYGYSAAATAAGESAASDSAARQDPAAAPGWFDKLSWLLLAASGSVILLAITNKMSQDVAVVPFLWVVPLSLYLLTFIICFERDAWYLRRIWLPVLALSVGGLAYLLRQEYASADLSIGYQITIYCAALFGCCMVCHGELVRRRPSARHLTSFYVYIALGGALGGVLVNLVAPLLFSGFWELHIVLVFICAAAVGLVATDRQALKPRQRQAVVALGYIGVGLLVWQLGAHIAQQKSSAVFSRRNFFGVLYVYESMAGSHGHNREMYHGRIKHGAQLLYPAYQRQPTTYYGPKSGVGLVLEVMPTLTAGESDRTPISVGGIGLGIGTIAAHGHAGDRYCFYEINPDVEYAADRYFSFLKDSPAAIEIRIGDGRRLLQDELDRDGSRDYDVMVVDAFSGDAIPMHLLTREAAALYWRHLKDDGVLALHITNRFVDLTGVARGLAAAEGKEAIYVVDKGRGRQGYYSEWVLITSNADFLAHSRVLDARSSWPHTREPVVWTDDFSNLLEAILSRHAD